MTELVLRLIVGIFFATSGYHKLFVLEVRDKSTALFTSLGVPKWQQPLVKWGEFLGGLGLLAGLFTQLAAGGLILITFGAIVLDAFKTDVIAKHPRDPLDWCVKTISMVEFWLIVVCTYLVFTGAGPISGDAFAFHLRYR